MELAVAVHTASEFTGRVQLSVFPYLSKRLNKSRHEPEVKLPSLSRFIKMDPALCFMAMRLGRSMESNVSSSETPGFDSVISRIGMAGIDAITVQALANQAFNEVHHPQELSRLSRTATVAGLINSLTSPSEKNPKRHCTGLSHLGAFHGEPSPDIDLRR